MSAPQTKITLVHDKEAAGDLQSQFQTQAFTKESHVAGLEMLLQQIVIGIRNASVTTVIDNGDAVSASDTLTLTGVSTAADTILINGVTLTAVASGAVNNQWNVQGSAALQATEIARAINASSNSLVSGHVSAAAVGAVVTLTAVIPGVAGNAVTTAKGTDAGSVMTFSAARLAGGLAATGSASQAWKFGL